MGYNTADGRAEITAVAAQTDFDFVFKIYTDEDIVAWLTPTGEDANEAEDLLILDVDYTVEVNGDDGGVFTLLSAATAGDSVTLVRNLSSKRFVEYAENGDLRPSVLNSDQNYQTYLIADTLVTLESTLKLPSNAQGIDGTLPYPLASAYIRWSADGKSLENDDTIPANVQLAIDSAAAALGSEEAAAVSAAAALISQSAAAASALAALASQNAAAVSAAAALVSQNAAAVSEVATGEDAVATAADRAAVETLYDDYDDRYLGSKASDPTTDNDGDPLLAGATYWNTTNSLLMFYNGAAWESPDLSASQSAVAALASQNAAALSEGNAGDSEAAALVSEDNAAISEAAAAASAAAALASENAAAEIVLTPLTKAFGNLISPLLSLPLVNNLSMDKGIGSVAYSLSSTSTKKDRYGNVKYHAIDEPRFEADGLLIEGANTNTAIHSEDFSNADYVKSQCTISANSSVAPDGATTMDKFIPDVGATSISRLTTLGKVTSVGTWAISMFFKADEFDTAHMEAFSSEDGGAIAEFDLTNGTVSSSSGSFDSVGIEHIVDDIYKCSIIKTYTGLTSEQINNMRIAAADVASADGIKGYYGWGLDVKKETLVSSYIPTTTTAIPRGTTDVEATALNNVGTSTSMTIMADVKLLGTSTSHQTLCKVGTVVIYAKLTSSNFLQVFNGATNYISSIDLSDGVEKRIAVVFDATTGYIYADGVLDRTFPTVDVETTSTLLIGKWTGNQWYLDGHIKNFKIFGEPKTTEEIRIA